jgi:hypothetical protein
MMNIHELQRYVDCILYWVRADDHEINILKNRYGGDVSWDAESFGVLVTNSESFDEHGDIVFERIKNTIVLINNRLVSFYRPFTTYEKEKEQMYKTDGRICQAGDFEQCLEFINSRPQQKFYFQLE